MVSNQLIEELKIIIKEDYGLELKQNEANEIAITLVNFFDLLANIQIENNVKQ